MTLCKDLNIKICLACESAQVWDKKGKPFCATNEFMDMLQHSKNKRQEIIFWMKGQPKHAAWLRIAVQQVCPEYVGMFDKLAILL